VAISKVTARVICKLIQPTFTRLLLRLVAPARDSILPTVQSNYVRNYVTSTLMLFNHRHLTFFFWGSDLDVRWNVFLPNVCVRCVNISTAVLNTVTFHPRRTSHSVNTILHVLRIQPTTFPKIFTQQYYTFSVFNLLLSWRFSHNDTTRSPYSTYYFPEDFHTDVSCFILKNKKRVLVPLRNTKYNSYVSFVCFVLRKNTFVYICHIFSAFSLKLTCTTSLIIPRAHLLYYSFTWAARFLTGTDRWPHL
jgi:hypothetical protein